METDAVKANIKKYYDAEAASRDSKTERDEHLGHFDQDALEAASRDSRTERAPWKAEVRGKFCETAKRESKKTLLELGAGAGYDSRYFMSQGFAVAAVDISKEMVKRCREKSIEAYEMDFYKLSTLNRKFDCVYAINTLSRVPKNDLRHVLNEIYLVLEDDGLFYMGLYGGEDTENEIVISEISDAPRFFAFHSERYLRDTLSGSFDILDFETLEIGQDNRSAAFHSIIARKKKPDYSSPIVAFADAGELKTYHFVVIFALYQGKWLYCRAGVRDTFETAGGHIELNETALDAARRELYEETGALKYDIEPAFDYSVRIPTSLTHGQVFFARVHELGPLPDYEMAETKLFDTIPDRMRFPWILPLLYEKMLEWLKKAGHVS